MLSEKKGIPDNPYKLNPTNYLTDEFEKIRLLLLYTVQQFRQTNPPVEGSFNNFFISDRDIDAILKNNTPTIDQEKQITPLLQIIEKLDKQIKEKRQLCEERGFILPMSRLRACFDLSEFEVNVLLVCLVPYFIPDYERVFAYLQNDASLKYPSIHLIERILTGTFEERCRARDYFSLHMPLLKWQLLCANDNQWSGALAPSALFSIDDRIAAFLTGSTILDSKTETCLRVMDCDQSIAELLLPQDLKATLKTLIEYFQQEPATAIHHVLALDGPSGGGKKQAAAIMAKTIGVPLFSLKVGPILSNLELFQKTIRRVLREVMLLGAALLIEDYELLTEEKQPLILFRDFLLNQIQDCCWLCFIVSVNELGRPDRFLGNRYIRLHFPIPDFSLRVKIWEAVQGNPITATHSISSTELANRFKFNETQIRNALKSARDNAFSRSVSGSEISETDLLKGCWSQCNQNLSKLALKIKATSTWNELVLPDEQLTLLQEVCSHFRYQSVVYSQWGFNEKILYGKGLSVLFSGPSGTGKTMAAGIIARDLKLELYKIDLSTIVSKYIGETEKNLSKIFNEAETSNAILFFDEADALFGKRSEITNSHDRYANIETSYLLQKMEEYEGITILASNFRQNMDQAFTRRMQFIVEFPFPDQKLRERLWRGVFPTKAPLQPDIDYDFLSSRLKLPGGNIKNIAINASFFAAEEHSDIQIRHIMLAAKREYTKLGMSFVRSDMVPYIELIEEGSGQ